MGGYASWGRGTVTIADSGNGKKTYTLEYEYIVDDMYNWDGNKSVKPLGIEITDKDLAALHLAGVAKEYRLIGSHKATVVWTN